MKAVILAAGKSTRTRPLTLTRPKPLLPLFFEPLIYYNIRNLATYVDEFVIVVGYKGGMIRDTLGDNFEGIPISYAEQSQQRGTADALLAAKSFLDGAFVLLNGDDLYFAEDVLRIFDVEGSGVLGVPVDDPGRFGMLIALDDVAESDKLIRIDEKPERTSAKLANSGFYKLDMDIFSLLEDVRESSRGELELVDAITQLAGKEKISIVESRKGFLSVATGMDLLNVHFALKADFGLCDGSYLAKGDIDISPMNSEIASPSLVDAIIGEGCRMFSSTTIKSSLLFDGVTLGSGTQITNSVLGEGVTVNEGVTVKNCVIGDGEIIEVSIVGQTN